MENILLGSALHYIRQGLSVFPVGWESGHVARGENGCPIGCGHKRKRPLVEWKKYQTELPTEADVRTWWGLWPDAGIGMATGSLSGLGVLDAEATADFTTFGISENETPTSKSGGGGRHYFFRFDEGLRNATRVLGNENPHDFRGEGGYVLLPPSPHESGNAYEWITPIGAVEPMVLPLKVRTALCHPHERTQKKDWLVKLGMDTVEGSRNNTATSIAGKLLLRIPETEWDSHVWPLLLSWNKTHAVPPLGERELQSIYSSIRDKELARRVAGNAVGEPSIEDHDGDFSVHVPVQDGFAVFLFSDVVFSRGEIEAIVSCHIEIPGQIERAFVSRLNTLAVSSRNTFAQQLTSSFGKNIPWALVLSQACSVFSNAYMESVSKRLVRASELKDEPTSYVLRPFIEASSVNLVFGKKSSCKTYAVIRMMMSVVAGFPFLGILPERTGSVLFLDYEANGGKFKNRLRRLAHFIGGFEDRHLNDLFYLAAEGRPITNMIEVILRLIREHGIVLLVIDSAALACDGPVEESSTANRFFNALNRLKTTVLVIGHTPKHDEKELDIFGSSHFMNGCRNAWNIQRGSDEQDDRLAHLGLFHRKSNNAAISPTRAVRFFFDGEDGPVDVSEESTGRWMTDGKRLGRIILGFFDGLGDGEATLQDVYAAMPDTDERQIRSRVSEMANDGAIVRSGRGKYRKAVGRGGSPSGAVFEEKIEPF